MSNGNRNRKHSLQKIAETHFRTISWFLRGKKRIRQNWLAEIAEERYLYDYIFHISFFWLKKIVTSILVS